jgi:hypothetical protein
MRHFYDFICICLSFCYEQLNSLVLVFELELHMVRILRFVGRGRFTLV